MHLSGSMETDHSPRDGAVVIYSFRHMRCSGFKIGPRQLVLVLEGTGLLNNRT